MSAQTTETKGCPSQLRLDELVGGEDAPGRDETARHVAGCVACAARVAAAKAERAAFGSGAPALDLRRRRAVRPARRRWLFGAAAMSLGALALVATGTLRRAPNERRKGAPVAEIYVKGGAIVRAVASGDTVRAGESVQFEFPEPGDAYVGVLGRDGTGRAAVVFPAEPRAARPATAGRFSIVLDAAPGPETFHVLFCETPVALESPRASLEGHGALAAPPGCAVQTVTLEKRLP